MLIDVKCPKCQEKIPVTESVSEQKIDCHNCGKVFPVPGTGKPAEPKPKEKDKGKDRDRDEPRGKTSSSRRADDDDDDDRGSRRRKDEHSGSGMVGLLIFGGIGLAVLAVGFGITAWLIFSKDDKPESADNSSKPDTKQVVPNNNNPPPKNNNIPGVPAKPPIDDDPPIRPKTPKPMVEEPDDPPPPPKKNPPRVNPPKKEPEVPGAPPPAADSAFVKLPSPVGEQYAIGASGKYLFLHIKASQQIAVFDAAEKKIIKYITATDGELLLAAGSEHLLIGYPNRAKIERVPYATWDMDKSMDVPSKYALIGMAMGSGAKGPLLISCNNLLSDQFSLVDVATMKSFANSGIRKPGIHPDPNMRLWASQDGRTFAAQGPHFFGKGATFQMRTTGWLVNETAFALNGMTSDGELVLGAGQIGGVGGQVYGEKKQERGKTTYYFPAAPGPYFCSINERTFGEWPKEKKWPELQIHIGRSQEPLVTFPELPELAEIAEFFHNRTKPLDRHIFFFPEQEMVAILPANRDKIHWRPVKLKEELASTKINYLAVTSRPQTVKFGETFKYKPEILCKKGPPTLRLDAAPVGMKLDGDSLVWMVPVRKDQPPANVILSVTDAGGQEIFHSFEVTVFAK